MALTEAQKRARERYRKKITRVTIEFSLRELDLIAHLDKQEQRQTYIKNLIREDMKKQEDIKKG